MQPIHSGSDVVGAATIAPVGAVVTSINGNAVTGQRDLWMNAGGEGETSLTYVFNGVTKTVKVKGGRNLGLRGSATNVK